VFAAGFAVSISCLPFGCGKRETQKRVDKGTVLVSSGRAPREALRYDFRRGDVLHYRLVSERSILGAAAPAEKKIQHLSHAVDRVRGPRAQVRWRLEPGPDQARGAVGRTLWLQLTSRGVVEAVAPGKGEGELEPWLKEALRTAYPRFPAQALGAGARWRETRTQKLHPEKSHPAVETRLEAEYTLERFAPCGRTRCAMITVLGRVSLSQRVGARSLRGSGVGRGQLTFDLDRGVLVSSSSVSEVEIGILGPGGQARENLVLRQELVEVRPPIGRGRPAREATPAPAELRNARGSTPPASRREQ
jgi:hypothetical protein